MGLLNNKEMSYGGVVIVGLSSLPQSRKCVFFFINVFLGKKSHYYGKQYTSFVWFN